MLIALLLCVCSSHVVRHVPAARNAQYERSSLKPAGVTQRGGAHELEQNHRFEFPRARMRTRTHRARAPYALRHFVIFTSSF